MKGFLALSVLVSLVMMAIPSASAGEGDIRNGPSMMAMSDPANQNPVLATSSWKASGRHGYYGRWDHRWDRGFRSDPFFDRHRHGHYHKFQGHHHHHGIDRFYGKGYYKRPHPGAYFGFSTCYRSGSVLVCVNKSHPYGW